MNGQNMFSLSTCWNVSRHSSGNEMIKEIIELGFKRVELNYKVTGEMFKEIIPMVDKGEIQISSIHNVFPYINNDAFGTDSLLLGYPDEKLRKEAVNLTIQSVECAYRSGAHAVVIHPGEIPLSKNYNALLEELIIDGRKDSDEYKKLFSDMYSERESNSEYYLNFIHHSLEEICEHIMKKNYDIYLGLENRMMCHQIPVFNEINTLLAKTRELPVYFWFDIGHGMLMEDLGMFDSLKEANKIKDKIIGMHIHDTVKRKDHLCPFLHSENVNAYIELIREVPIKVLELGSRWSGEEIKRSTEILMNKINA